MSLSAEPAARAAAPGNHTEDAWALVRSSSGRVRVRSRADIVDIAATALAPFGLESAGRSLIDA